MDPSARVTEKPSNQNQHIQRHQQQLLKCPRCESMNTKFCYYNNYSFSQPRHFCKACKRFWTRGGALRNVPMGGGCKKNKKIKKTFTSTIDHNPNPNNLDHSTQSKDTLINPLFGLIQANPNHQTRVLDHMGDSKYDLNDHTRIEYSFAFGFSPSDGGNVIVDHNHDHDLSVSHISSYLPIFSGGFTSSCNSDHSMAPVLASGLQEQPGFLSSALFGDGGGSVVNDVQIVGTKISMDDYNDDLKGKNDEDGHEIKRVESSDPTSFLWTIPDGEGGEWTDPASSLVSLI